MEKIKSRIKHSIEVKELCLKDNNLLLAVSKSVEACVDCFRNNGKIFFCGNGGSAADAQHLASELSGKFYLERPPLFAEALHVNTSHITAVANDYSFDKIYSRLIEAKGSKGDILFAISTSGQSPNIIEAVNKANDMELLTIGMIGGAEDSILLQACDVVISIPSSDTPRIQECHILLGHIICELVEASLYS